MIELTWPDALANKNTNNKFGNNKEEKLKESWKKLLDYGIAIFNSVFYTYSTYDKTHD